MLYSRNLFEPFTSSSKGIFSQPQSPIAFTGGVAQLIDPSNQYVFPILRAEQSTFSHNADKNTVAKTSGSSIALVSGYQTRGNQRVAISGSLSLCSNDNMQMT